MCACARARSCFSSEGHVPTKSEREMGCQFHTPECKSLINGAVVKSGNEWPGHPECEGGEIVDERKGSWATMTQTQGDDDSSFRLICVLQ